MICKSLFIYWYFVVYLLHLFLSYLTLPYLYFCFLPLHLPLSLSYCRAAMKAFEKICNCHDISIAVSWQYYLQQVQAILLLVILYESKSWILKKCDRKNIDIVELCCSKFKDIQEWTAKKTKPMGQIKSTQCSYLKNT